MAVAKAMNAPTFQGTLYRFCKGRTLDPDRNTIERIAKHFKLPIEAMYDAALATEIYKERIGSGPDEVRPGVKREGSRRATEARDHEEDPGLKEYLKYLADQYPLELTDEELAEEKRAYEEFATNRLAKRLLKYGRLPLRADRSKDGAAPSEDLKDDPQP